MYRPDHRRKTSFDKRVERLLLSMSDDEDDDEFTPNPHFRTGTSPSRESPPPRYLETVDHVRPYLERTPVSIRKKTKMLPPPSNLLFPNRKGSMQDQRRLNLTEDVFDARGVYDTRPLSTRNQRKQSSHKKERSKSAKRSQARMSKEFSMPTASPKRVNTSVRNKSKIRRNSCQASTSQFGLATTTKRENRIQNSPPSCLKSKMESRQLKKEVEELKDILSKKQKKIDSVVTKLHKEKRKAKDTQRVLETGDRHWATEVELLQERVKDLRRNEDSLISDLVQQQKIAKESLRAIEDISKKFDREKQELLTMCEERQSEIFNRERLNYLEKISTLEQLAARLQKQINRADDMEHDIQVKNRLMQDSETALNQAKSENSRLHQHNVELREKLKDIEGELEEARASYLDQHKTYEAHLQMLKNQISSVDGEKQRQIERNAQQFDDELRLKSEEIKLLRNELELAENNYKNKITSQGERDLFFEKQIDDLKHENDTLRRQLDQQSAKAKEAEQFAQQLQEIREELQVQKEKYHDRLTRSSSKRQQEKTEWGSVRESVKRSQIYEDMKNEIATLRGEIDNLTLENKNLHRKFSSGIRSSGQPHHSANFSQGSYLRPPSTASQMPHSAPFQPVQSHSRYGSHHYIGTEESKTGRSPKQPIMSPGQEASPTRVPASGRNFVSTGNFTPTPQQNLGGSTSSNFNLQNFNQNATVGQSMQGSIVEAGGAGFEGLSDMAANISLSAPDNDKYQTESSFLKEKLREKEDEVKILWSVIKDFNKKRNEGQQLSAEDMKQHIQSKIETSPYKM